MLAALSLGGVMAVTGRRRLVSLSGRYELALAEQIRQTTALQDEDWVSRGRAQLTDELRGELDERQVCARVVAALARYLDASVGRAARSASCSRSLPPWSRRRRRPRPPRRSRRRLAR